MTVSEYLIHCIVKTGCTDIFGIPGGVVLDFLYAAENNADINIHLCAHEQGAGFAAIGYAQAAGKIGVAYATRGPGFTNLYTNIADAYFDAIPVLFITAHSKNYKQLKERFEEEQEFDTVGAIEKITKYAARIESVEEAPIKIQNALAAAITGTPGPVFLDFLLNTWNQEISLDNLSFVSTPEAARIEFSTIQKIIIENIKKAKKPILLIGAGIRQSRMQDCLNKLVECLKIPVLSSTVAQDVCAASSYYFGYIGSHGLRYANYILDESDLVIAFGNRLLYDKQSKTFSSFALKKVIQFDIEHSSHADENNIQFIRADLVQILPLLAADSYSFQQKTHWLKYCSEIKNSLLEYDTVEPVHMFSKLLKSALSDIPIVADVGNNEFFLARAYAYSNCSNNFFMAKSFAAMGCAIPKAIGIHYAVKKKVISVMGDQAAVMNMQEFQYIADCKLPITIVIMNNYASGMIKSKQKSQNRTKFVHTTCESGYHVPDFKKIALAFGIPYYDFNDTSYEILVRILNDLKQPSLIEMKVSSEWDLPILPKGNKYYEFIPEMSDKTKNTIEGIRRRYEGLF